MSSIIANLNLNLAHNPSNPNIQMLDESIIHEGVVLFRIVAVRSFNGIERGTKGGYVASLNNISKEAWIADSAKVYGNGHITDKAIASGHSQIKDNATVSNRARIEDHAVIKDNAKVFNWARVIGNALVCKYGQVSQHASISGWAEIRGIVYGHTIFTCRAYVEESKIVPGLSA